MLRNVLLDYSAHRPIIPVATPLVRHLEIRLPVSGLERGPGCHPERSEGSLRPASQTLRCAQGDRHYLQMSSPLWASRPHILMIHAHKRDRTPTRGVATEADI